MVVTNLVYQNNFRNLTEILYYVEARAHLPFMSSFDCLHTLKSVSNESPQRKMSWMQCPTCAPEERWMQVGCCPQRSGVMTGYRSMLQVAWCRYIKSVQRLSKLHWIEHISQICSGRYSLVPDEMESVIAIICFNRWKCNIKFEVVWWDIIPSFQV